MAEIDLKTKTTVSLLWSFLDKFGHQLINLFSSIILMAVVVKGEFAIMGILAVFVAFSNLLIDSGFSRALLNRKEISDAEYSTVFYFNMALASVVYLLLFFAIPFFAQLFHEPRITPVARVLFISFIFNGLGLIQQTLLVKRADFRGLTKVNIPAVVLAAVVAVVLAVKGYGVWALVAQVVGHAAFRSLFLWIYTSWRPVLQFDLALLRNSLSLSSKLLAASLVSAFFNNIYPAIIAFFFPNQMNSVADYTQANKYQDIPFAMVSNTFRSIAMLILSEIKEETERLKRVLSKLLKTIAFITFPGGMLMILIAEPTFELIWQDKWLSAVPYFQLLTLAGMVSPFTFVLSELYIARERADLHLGLEIGKRIMLVALIALFLSEGIVGLALSWVVYTYVTLIISLIISGRLIQYTLWSFIKDAVPYIAIALAAFGASYYLTQGIESNLLFILAGMGSMAVVYLALSKILKLEMIRELEEWFLKKRS